MRSTKAWRIVPDTVRCVWRDEPAAIFMCLPWIVDMVESFKVNKLTICYSRTVLMIIFDCLPRYNVISEMTSSA